jgi:hypothetical protein
MHVEKGGKATKVVVLLYGVGAWFYIDSFFRHDHHCEFY